MHDKVYVKVSYLFMQKDVMSAVFFCALLRW